MIEEKELKKEGEELAKVAVESGMGSKQLRGIYKIAKTKSMAFVQAFIQRQIGRGLRGVSAFDKTLELSRKYQDNKGYFERVLMYAVMLYDYFEVAPTMKLRVASEPVVRDVFNRRGIGFDCLELKSGGNWVNVTVKTRRFHGNPKALAMEIERELKNKVPEFRNVSLRIWIE